MRGAAEELQVQASWWRVRERARIPRPRLDHPYSQAGRLQRFLACITAHYGANLPRRGEHTSRLHRGNLQRADETPSARDL